MQFDWSTFAFQLVNIAVLLWLLGRFLFRPVAAIIAERKAATESVMQEAAQAKLAAKQAEEAVVRERDQIAAQRVEMLEKARREAETQKQDLVGNANKEAAAIVQKARTEARKVLDEERSEELRRAATLSVTMTGRLLAGMPVDARIDGYPERLVEALEALDPKEKEAILADRETLCLVAPRELTANEHEALRRKLSSTLSLDGSLPVEVDETLIAGMELKSRHGVVRNSLAADLARIAEALDGEDKG